MRFRLFSLKKREKIKCNSSSHLNCNLSSFYLVEHVSEIILWVYPGGHCVAEEYKVLFQRRQMRQHFNLRTHQQHNSDRHLAAASLTCTTPPGFTLIIVQIPLNAESFSSLSLMFRREVHLTTGTARFNMRHRTSPQATSSETWTNLLTTATMN